MRVLVWNHTEEDKSTRPRRDTRVTTSTKVESSHDLVWPAGRAAAKQARDRCPEHPAPAWNASAAAGLAEDTEIERKMHNWVKPATLRAHGIAVRANPCTSWVLLPSQALS